MRHVGQQRAEGDNLFHPGHLGNMQHGSAVSAPAQVRLGAQPQNQVMVRLGAAQNRELGRGPDDFATSIVAVDPLHGRAMLGEHEELVGVERGDGRGGVEVAQELERVGGGFGGVVPAEEGEEQDRAAQIVG